MRITVLVLVIIQMTGHYIMISRKRASVNVAKHMIASYVLSLIDSNNNVSKRMWSYIKSKKIDYYGLLLCDIMTELTLTPKIKPLYLMITLHLLKTVPCQLCMDGAIHFLIFHLHHCLYMIRVLLTYYLTLIDDHEASGPDKIPITM